ncbi:hypothetical protein MESS2_790065 [Mesorhizobium metallidurans STM 2683]|uniref:N-acetyltransferase domain-containing protein n=1 Tax=Mesorhizobium metallidurans STM 2683 TaxID=1297569 RepID=M5EXN4_9HYPH|nr:hypothetical protein MESS2_790065 [Mesorhizobium metallidurans STM 2683]
MRAPCAVAAVGWCQVTPRDAVPWLDRLWQLKRVDDAPVWSLSCLYVRKGYRRQGVTSHLIAAGLETARRANAPALEAYPFDADVSPSASGSGYASTFARAGSGSLLAGCQPARSCVMISSKMLAMTYDARTACQPESYQSYGDSAPIAHNLLRTSSRSPIGALSP